MFGSIAGSESLVLGDFDADFRPRTVMAEAPHGTAPSLEGKNIANPLAMILAGAALLPYLETPEAGRASRAIYESSLEAIYDGVGTPDLGLSATTIEYTNEVIARVKKRLDVWDHLG
jgi:isocitrate/isopropylmalate dehydrogenase